LKHDKRLLYISAVLYLDMHTMRGHNLGIVTVKLFQHHSISKCKTKGIHLVNLMYLASIFYFWTVVL